jgi:hypothetical protein
MSTEKLKQIMGSGEAHQIGVRNMTESQRVALYEWGMRMFDLGQHVTGYIDEIKRDGRLVVLDDGSRWDVDSYDASTSDLWSVGSKVVVIDDEMFLLDESEKVSVEENLD